MKVKTILLFALILTSCGDSGSPTDETKNPVVQAPSLADLKITARPTFLFDVFANVALTVETVGTDGSIPFVLENGDYVVSVSKGTLSSNLFQIQKGKGSLNLTISFGFNNRFRAGDTLQLTVTKTDESISQTIEISKPLSIPGPSIPPIF